MMGNALRLVEDDTAALRFQGREAPAGCDRTKNSGIHGF